MVRVNNNVSLRDLIYIGLILVSATTAFMTMRAMAETNRKSIEIQQEINADMKDILKNHEGRLTTLESAKIEYEAYQRGLADGKGD